jgi:hypothetical protein
MTEDGWPTGYLTLATKSRTSRSGLLADLSLRFARGCYQGHEGALSQLASGLLFFGGAILTLLTSALAVREARFRNRAARTSAIVRKRQVKLSRDEGGTMEAVKLTVEFEDATGVKRQATSSVVADTSGLALAGRA